MANVRLTIPRLREAVGKLIAAGGQDATRDVEEIMVEASQMLTTEARSRAPIGTVTHKIGRVTVYPGSLRNAIHFDRSKHRHPRAFSAVTLRIAPHAFWIEFGHRKRPSKAKASPIGFVEAQPFFGPALKVRRRQIENYVIDGIAHLYDKYNIL